MCHYVAVNTIGDKACRGCAAEQTAAYGRGAGKAICKLVAVVAGACAGDCNRLYGRSKGIQCTDVLYAQNIVGGGQKAAFSHMLLPCLCAGIGIG